MLSDTCFYWWAITIVHNLAKILLIVRESLNHNLPLFPSKLRPSSSKSLVMFLTLILLCQNQRSIFHREQIRSTQSQVLLIQSFVTSSKSDQEFVFLKNLESKPRFIWSVRNVLHFSLLLKWKEWNLKIRRKNLLKCSFMLN